MAKDPGWSGRARPMVGDAYRDFLAARARPMTAPRAALLLRLLPAGPQGARTLVDACAFLQGALGATLTMDRPEQVRFDALRAVASNVSSPRTAVVYADPGALPSFPDCVRLDHIGAAADLDAGPAAAALPASLGAAASPPPVTVGVVDHAIGFLNCRFRTGPRAERTRFYGHWVQALERRVTGGGIASGRVLDAAAISAMLTNCRDAADEAAHYARLAEELHRPQARAGTGLGFSHGTHVADLAAGAEPGAGDPVEDWALLGVSLPPEAIEDTSGHAMAAYLVQGVRWIFRTAEEMGGAGPVIVNLSLGVLAGAKDGSHVVARAVERERAAFAAATGRAAHVVLAFGNWQRSRQVARLTDIPAGGSGGLDWRLQPDDHTASFLELRFEDIAGPPRTLKLSLAHEGGPAAEVRVPAAGKARSLVLDGKEIGALYHVEPPAPDPGEAAAAPYLCLAMAPTARDHEQTAPSAGGASALAPAGRWTLQVSNGTDAPTTVNLAVQRDDSVAGYRQRARQSYLDHRDAYGWDAETADHTNPAASPITREGTHSAYAGAAAAATVGAARCPDLVAAPYSSRGAGWTLPAPSGSAVGDEAPALPGVLAAGTFSGAVRALSGTSGAAPQWTRALGLGTLPAPGSGTPGPDRAVLGDRTHVRREGARDRQPEI